MHTSQVHTPHIYTSFSRSIDETPTRELYIAVTKSYTLRLFTLEFMISFGPPQIFVDSDTICPPPFFMQAILVGIPLEMGQ